MSKQIEHTSVPGINVELNKKLGYYVVNNEIYYHKLQALMAASKFAGERFKVANENDRVRWMFNEDVFLKYPWHIEPDVPLKELYRQRAQQLRDTYDYIRLELSGGSDSTTVAYSFLLNNIHLDEVVFRYPKQGDKNVSNNPWDTRAQNTLSEWEFAAKPLLNWIATNFPKVKVTIHDYSEEILDEEDTKDESWIFRTRHYLQPGHAHKFTNSGLVESVADTGQRIAVVHGIDKPKICVKDGKFFMYFFDTLANSNNPDLGEYTNITNEFFFWSPDFPELLAKQAHLVKNWFSMPQNFQYTHTLNWPNNHFASRQLYEWITKGIIYPDYDFNTFQTSKPSNNIYNEMDHWFHTNFKDTKLYNTWEAGIDYLINNLSDHYLYEQDGEIRNIKDFVSTLYYLGDSTIPDSKTQGLQTREFIRDARNDQTKYVHCINGKLSIY